MSKRNIDATNATNALEVNAYCSTCFEETGQLWKMVLPSGTNEWLHIKLCFSCDSEVKEYI